MVFPELLVLQHLHGDDAITEIAVVGEWDASNDQVLERLRVIYPAKVVTEVFPGTKPKLPLGDGTIPRCNRRVYVAPPTRPDNPDPLVTPLDSLTLPAAAPAPAPELPSDRPLSEAEVQAEMQRMFGEQFPPDLEAAAPEIVPETDQQFVQRTVATAMQGVTASAKPNQPDPAAFRARDNIRGQGTKAPRTADHLPDVAGGALRDATQRDPRSRQEGSTAP